jgi:aspartyl-tRNA(Asn)/glutamyl-tRNA(Gln) amidotransferase subunit A
MLGALVSGVDYVQAVRRRRELRAELQTAMRDLDLVLTAAAPSEAPKIDAVPKWDLFERPNFTMPFNVSGYPAISVCAGFGTDGLPVAIQLAGKPFAEPTLLRAADAFEKATPFRDAGRQWRRRTARREGMRRSAIKKSRLLPTRSSGCPSPI